MTSVAIFRPRSRIPATRISNHASNSVFGVRQVGRAGIYQQPKSEALLKRHGAIGTSASGKNEPVCRRRDRHLGIEATDLSGETALRPALHRQAPRLRTASAGAVKPRSPS